jgi:hypothetical protein
MPSASTISRVERTCQVGRLPGLVYRAPSQVLVHHGRSVFHQVAQVSDRKNLFPRGRPGLFGNERGDEEVLLDFVSPTPVRVNDSAAQDREQIICRGDRGGLISRMGIFRETEPSQVFRLGQVLVHLGGLAGGLAAVDRGRRDCRPNIVVEAPQHRGEQAH